MSARIRRCTFAELEASPSFQALAAEYAEETAIAGLGDQAGKKLELYRTLDACPFFAVWGAFVEDRLVGFIALLTPVMPHYGVAVAVTESFFVAKDDRKSGAGLGLLREAEAHAKEAGAPGILVSAPTGGQLEKVLLGLEYRETNRVFLRVLQ